ncbi:MAG: ROK family protein [Planctomycetes bacterium]|nr:ROK family protein [Planctomycetota bacterium]
MILIGVDVGGTHTRVGAVDGAGRLLRTTRLLTPSGADGARLVALIARAFRKITEPSGESIDAVGLALPGLVDAKTGRLIRSVNLTNIEGNPIADALGVEIGLPVHLLTDIQAATWAEYGALDPRPGRFVHLRLGTGAGLCAVLNGQLEAQDPTRSTHHPLLVVDPAPTAAKCPCGLRGCLEGFVAAPALVARMSEHVGCGELRELQMHYDAGESFALAIIDLAGDALAVALENVSRTYDADVVSVGGGVIMALPSLLGRAVEAYGARLHADRSQKRSSIRAAQWGDDAGVMGAARLAARPLFDSTLVFGHT